MGPRMREEDTERGGMMTTRFLEGLGMTCWFKRRGWVPACARTRRGAVDGDGRFANRPYGERRREGNEIPRGTRNDIWFKRRGWVPACARTRRGGRDGNEIP